MTSGTLLQFVLLIYVYALLFESIAQIEALREVGAFLKFYHILVRHGEIILQTSKDVFQFRPSHWA